MPDPLGPAAVSGARKQPAHFVRSDWQGAYGVGGSRGRVRASLFHLSHRLAFRRWGQSPVRRTFELRASRRRLKSYRMPLLLQASVQALEGEFDVILRFALGWSGRRNDVAHGRARPSSWIIESETQGLVRYCVIPPHFRAAKFTEERPAYVLSSREIRRFGEAFWELAHRIGRFFREIEGWHLA